MPEASVQLDTADLQEPSVALALKTERLKARLVKLDEEMEKLAAIEKRMLASPNRFRSPIPQSPDGHERPRGSGVGSIHAGAFSLGG